MMTPARKGNRVRMMASGEAVQRIREAVIALARRAGQGLAQTSALAAESGRS
jgi:hypothetical protein